MFGGGYGVGRSDVSSLVLAVMVMLVEKVVVTCF